MGPGSRETSLIVTSCRSCPTFRATEVLIPKPIHGQTRLSADSPDVAQLTSGVMFRGWSGGR
jgi:hypothetical protein